MRSIKLAVDVGSGKTSMYQVGAGVILSEPSIVAVSGDGRRGTNAVGADAKRLLGKSAKNTTVFSPILEGEIEKPEAARVMLADFLKKIEIGKFKNNVEVFKDIINYVHTDTEEK